MPSARKLIRINLDGTAWVDDGRGGEQAVQLVIAANGALGAQPIRGDQALGLDQVGTPSPLPPPPAPQPQDLAPKMPDKDDANHFDVSTLDQS